MVYDDAAHPYWFKDTNCDGTADAPASQYKSFTPRLVRACYNYMVSKKDPGGYAHNSNYIIAIVQKSIDDLNGYLY